MDEQLNQIAENTGVPADLLERAARARATAQGVDVGGLVASWAGGEAPAAPAAAEPPPVAPVAETAPPPAAAPAAEPLPPAAPAPAPAAPLEDMLGQVASATEVPADLLERAARARAGKAGVDVAALVAGWSGEAPPAAAAVADQPAPTAEPAPAAEPAAAADSGTGQLPEALVRRSAAARAKREGRPLDEVLVEMGLSPEGEAAAPAAEEAAAAAPTTTTAPAVAEEEPVTEEPVLEDEPQPVFAGFPRWLAASFIIVPMIALLYAGLSPNGPDCGTSGQLAINPVTGEAQACGGDASPFFSRGQAIYNAQCASCHGAGGGGGVGPAMAGGAVLQTFSACTDHVAWVTLGSSNWPDATYGDNAKPVGGTGVLMQGYEGILSPEDIAAVSLYERVQFGGEDIVAAEASCGLAEGAVEAAGE